MTGACLCGAVRYRIEGAALTARQCWCRDCQHLAAGGPTNNLFVRSEQLRWEGEVRWYESAADSGNVLAAASAPPAARPCSPNRTRGGT